MNLPFLIARRNLLKQKGNFSSFIIRIGIIATTLSVAIMIIAVAVVGGFNTAIRDKLYSFEGHIHIHEYGNNTFRASSMPPLVEDGYLEEKVMALPHVVQIAPYIKRAGILQSKGRMEGIMLKGVPDSFYFSKAISFRGSRIDYSDTAYSKDILLSEVTADRMELKPGDMLQLYFLEEGSAFPRIRKVRVAGTFHTGMEEMDRFYGLCDIRLLQNINDWEPANMNGYQVTLDNDRHGEQISRTIQDEYVGSFLYSFTMDKLYPNVFNWLNVTDQNGVIILVIMAVVAVISLAVALLILMVEQARMVGVLKAQGMKPGAIRMVFVYYAGLIAATGIVAGNAIALGLGALQHSIGFITLPESSYYMRTVPFRIVWWHVVAIDVATLVLCLACMLLPTLYLRRIQPAKVLQFK
ncbi:MAG: ABC transporter permease [Flavipsychrobacter sp.]|nr:ABC transporter permease [Flavipsychrobacter sp.]